ncbi:MAG: iron-containing alcohol dehydrogenase [Thermofilaceae archaeon]
MRFTFEQSGKIVFGRGTLPEVGRYAASLGSRALLVTGRSFAASSGLLQRLVDSLREANLDVVVFPEVEPNPSLRTVERGARLAASKGVDVVVGFGGGSPLDAAKAIAAVLALGGAPSDHLYPKAVEKALPVVALPTTTGTGSEVTQYSVLVDPDARKKVVMQGPALVPRVAILDADVTDYMPGRLVASTGFDALSHALEAFISRRASPLSNLFALEAARIILSNLPSAVKGSREARELMLYASMLAGVAINQAGSTLAHGLGYYLTVHHDLHHGVANALLLPHVLAFYAERVGKVDELAASLNFRSWEELVERVCKLADEVGIPDSAASVGVTESELDRMAEEAMFYRRNIENGPVIPSLDEIKQIYAECYEGRRALLRRLGRA